MDAWPASGEGKGGETKACAVWLLLRCCGHFAIACDGCGTSVGNCALCPVYM